MTFTKSAASCQCAREPCREGNLLLVVTRHLQLLLLPPDARNVFEWASWAWLSLRQC